MPIDLDERCMGCGHTRGDHIVTQSGAQRCPEVVRYFTPCNHPSSHGHGWISSGGEGGSEMWCDRCGKQLSFNRPAVGKSGD